MGNDYLITDTVVETVSAFEVLAEELKIVANDPYRWKWAIIALHSGLQGMMVLALQGSHGLHVLKSKDATKWLEAYERGEKCTDHLQLEKFLDLYKKIKGKIMLMYTESKKFVPTGTQGGSIKLLDRLRNGYVHFTPRVWALDLTGLPKMSKDCLEIAEFLAWESFNVTWSEDDLKRKAENAFKSAHNSLASIGDIKINKRKKN